jgi:predicted RNase H-like HicB family nuclease
MSAKSENRLKKSKLAKLDRPFEPRLLGRARDIARAYRVVIEPDSEVGYFGRVLEMPLVMAHGATVQACFEQVHEAAAGAVAVMLESGQTPPSATAGSKRTAQINVRVTEDERMRLEEAARQLGFRGVSDFIRATALSKTG